MSPQQERKRREQLGYQCPLITFASVQCSNDQFDPMDNTVMPLIEKQLKELQDCSVIVVYQATNVSGCFQSYMVPSSIRRSTVGFVAPDAALPAWLVNDHDIFFWCRRTVA
jgi:hypothetical protein